MSEQRDLRADLELCNKATHGKWQASYDDDIKDDVRVCQVENGECVCCLALMGNYDYDLGEWHYGDITEWRANADFIAAAREGWPETIKMFFNLQEENDLQRHSIQQLSAQVVGLREILVKTLPIIGELAESIGYGYYKPEDPRDFTPDFECCSKKEISNWKNDCVKADAGEEIGDIRLWGIGTYKIKDPGMIELRDKIKTILSSPDPGTAIRERMARLEKVAEAAEFFINEEGCPTGHVSSCRYTVAECQAKICPQEKLSQALADLEAVTPCT